ncbi:DZI1L protein, partial [Steatornis caripensis]|nr:DZI1L protein [Steatornis caripensis]
AAGMRGASPAPAIPVDIPPFRFQPRRLSMDWRRFSAIDVERVAREVDVAALQEHIAGVTFCNLDGERCPHCGQPVDPILLKVLRMAQLSIEYMLHCQDRLGTSLAVHAQRLQAAHAELARTQRQAAEQAAQLRGAKEESRRWKKLIAPQQLLLHAGPNACRKDLPPTHTLQAKSQQELAGCTLAHSASVSLSSAERQKVKPVEQMEGEVEELKAKLRETRQQLEAEREAAKLRGEQETERARQREEEGRRKLERWKEEEKLKLREEIDGLRQLFLTAFKDMASRSNAMEGKLRELQAREAAKSKLGTLRDDDAEEARWWAPSQAEPRGKRESVAAQVSSAVPTSFPLLRVPGGAFGWRWARIHAPLCASSSRTSGLISGSGSNGLLLMHPPACSPGHRPWVTVLVPAPAFTPDREEAALGGKRRLLEAPRRNPNLPKQFRPILEEVLEEKLENMGVNRVAKGIATRTYKSLRALIRLQQQQKAEKFPGLLCLRDELAQAVMGKVRRCKRLSSAFPRQLSIIPG